MHHLSRLILSFSLAVVLTAVAFGKTHSVVKGDNDHSIAKKYGITIDQLHKLNPKTDWKKLQIGQKVVVSKEVAKKAAPVAKAKTVSVQTTNTKISIIKTDVIVRAEPSTTSDRKGLVDKGQGGAVIERRNGWTKIKFGTGLIGWVRDDMLSVVKPVSKSTVAKAPKSSPVAKSGSLPDTPEKDAVIVKTDDSLKAKSVETVESGAEEKIVKEVPPETVVVTNGAPAAKAAVVAPPLKAQGFYADKLAFITADSVIIRSQPTTSSTRKATVSKGRTAEVLQRGGGWTKVQFSGGTTGWIRDDLLTVASTEEVNAMVAELRAKRAEEPETIALDPDASKVEKVLATAKSKTGTKYVYGASRSNAFDCSGFVLWTMSQHGIKLPRTAAQQAGVGSKVDRKNLQAGDLVFFQTTRGKRISHVGIYIGSGKFIHASSGGGKVMTSSLSEGYYNKRYVTARRIPGLTK